MKFGGLGAMQMRDKKLIWLIFAACCSLVWEFTAAGAAADILQVRQA